MGNGRADGEFALACASKISFTVLLRVHARINLFNNSDISFRNETRCHFQFFWLLVS